MLKVIFILECLKVKELRVPFVTYSFHEIHTHVLLKCMCMYNAVINTSLFLSSSAFHH